MIITDLKNEILKVPAELPVFIYVGVGTAAGLLNSNGTLDQENYHQFPPFLQDLRNRYPQLHLFLLLIDPNQENPPYLTKDYAVEEMANPDHYMCATGTLQVFVLRQMVYTDADADADQSNSTNLTTELHSLNNFALEQNASLLYHDYTGRDTAHLAEFFDPYYTGYLDQLVYGFGGREYHGCYIDLNQPAAYFAVKMVKYENMARPLVKMFNYYNFINNTIIYNTLFNNIIHNTFANEIATYEGDGSYIIEKQKECIIRTVQKQFKDFYLTMLRQVKLVLNNNLQDENLINTSFYENFPHNEQRTVFLDLYHEKQYQTIYNLLFEEGVKQLDMLGWFKNYEMTGAELMQHITRESDPYKWYNHLL